jgi:hypothetical protein
MPSTALANGLSLARVKMNNRVEIIHAHAQIIHFLLHENLAYSFLSVEVQPG